MAFVLNAGSLWSSTGKRGTRPNMSLERSAWDAHAQAIVGVRRTMRLGITFVLLAMLLSACAPAKPELEKGVLPSPPSVPASSGNSIETTVEYTYLPGHDPHGGAPYYKYVTTVTSDHVLSTNEISAIQGVLSANGAGPFTDKSYTYLSEAGVGGVKMDWVRKEDLHHTLKRETTENELQQDKSSVRGIPRR
jgi:hypothetical protein